MVYCVRNGPPISGSYMYCCTHICAGRIFVCIYRPIGNENLVYKYNIQSDNIISGRNVLRGRYYVYLLCSFQMYRFAFLFEKNLSKYL